MDKNNTGKILKKWVVTVKENPQKRLRVIMTVGLLGIFLIFLSECSFKGSEEADISENTSVTACVSSAELENRLKKMIEMIDGAGKTDVMITFENNGEKIYVSEEKVSEETDNTSDTQTSKRSEREESYIMVDSQNGGKTALISEELAPKIQGVVVICDGGDDPIVAEKLTRTVKTALNIGSNRICVLKRVN